MHKFLIALGLITVIVIENWVWPGWFAFVYGWSLGFMPWYAQAVLLVILCVVIAFAAAEVLGGLVGLPVLGILAVLPLLGFRLGWVDDQLGDVARQLATNPRDVQEVAQVHTYLHTSLVVVAAVLSVLILLAVVRRVFN